MKEFIKKIIKKKTPLIIFAEGNEKNKQDFYLYCFKQETFAQGQYIPKGSYLLTDKKNAGQLIYYGLIKEENLSESITAFILPYKELETCSITLDDSADLMVTPILTGCTFAVELGNKNPTVYHINKPIIVNNEWITDQVAIDKEIENFKKDQKYFTIKKSDYMSSKKGESSSATIIGLREDNQWHFYSQYLHVNQNDEKYGVLRGKQTKKKKKIIISIFSKKRTNKDIPNEKNIFQK